MTRQPTGVFIHESGFTAIEVTVALMAVSFLSIFALQVLFHLRAVQIDIQRVDTAVQIGRDVLNDLKAEPDWRMAGKRIAPLRRYDTEFTVQLQSRGSSQEGLEDLELTVSWIGSQGLEQMVFSTTVPKGEVGG